MDKGCLRSWLSIIATISLLAGLAPGAAAQANQQRSGEAGAVPPTIDQGCISSTWSHFNLVGNRSDVMRCASDTSGLAAAAAEVALYAQRPPTHALKRWTAGAIKATAVLAAIGRHLEKTPAEFDERLRWADGDGSLQVMVSLLHRDQAIERFIAGNTVDLSWYGDDPRFAARVTPSQLVTLLDSPIVLFVEPDYPITNFMSDSSADVGARTTDSSGVYTFDPAAGPMGGLVSNVEGLSAEEVTGAGVTVAVTDSGIDKTHRDFGGWDCEAGPYQPCDSRIVHAAATEHLLGFETSDALPTTDLFSAHGTHVAGTIAGNGYYTRDGDTQPNYGGDGHVIGIAPSASLISVKNGDSQSAAFAAAALQWQLDHAAEFGIKVSSNSWGCIGGCSYEPDSVTAQIQRDLYLAGVVTTFAVGNDGGGSDGAAFSGFAQSPYVVAVAAYDDANDRLAAFSSRGSTSELPNPSAWSPETEPASGLRRPDVAAPGVNIWSAHNVTGGTSKVGPRVNSSDVTGGPPEGVWTFPYQTMSGTSMATPHVSGAAAILFGACPGATNLDVMRALKFSADPAKINAGSAQPFEVGYGALNVRASLDRLLALPACGGTRSWESDEGFTPPPPPPTEDQCNVAGDDWCEEWIARFDGARSETDDLIEDKDDLTWPSAVLSRDGRQLFMMGNDVHTPPAIPFVNFVQPPTQDIVVAGFDTAGGENLWAARYPAGRPRLWGGGIAASPDGTKVFVVGTEGEYGIPTREIVTLAYSTATGEQLWAATVHSGNNGGQGIAVTPDGSTVLVVGNTNTTDIQQADIVTIAYDAATGEQRWLSSHGKPGFYDGGHAIAISPDGEFAYVTGSECVVPDQCEAVIAVTIAYAVSGDSAGEVQWVARYDGYSPEGVPGGDNSQGHHVLPSEDGERVFVAGFSGSIAGDSRITLVAYDSASGEQLWAAEWAGGTGNNMAVWKGWGGPGIAVSPDNGQVFVTGEAARASDGCQSFCQIPVLAYGQATGELRWSQTYSGETDARLQGTSIASSRDGSRVFVGGFATDGMNTGAGSNRVTLAYDSRTGDEVAVARRPDGVYGAGTTVLASPDGSRLYSTGAFGREPKPVLWGISSYLTPSDPDPEPTETTTASPSPTESGSASPSPSESPQPDLSQVSFTDNTAESGQHSDKTLFEARLADSNGDPIEGKELSFDLVGAESSRSFSATTDQDGVASVTPVLEERPGPHWLTVRFAGDEEHAADADTASFIIDKEDSALDLSVHGEDDNKTLSARLSDLDTSSEGIADRTIDLYSDGELIGSGVTDADGVASIALPPRHRGNNRTYEAVFEGDEFYLESSDDRPGKGKGGNGGGNGGGGNGGPASASYGGKVLLM